MNTLIECSKVSVRQSNIKNAGLGAFANTFIKKDEIVAENQKIKLLFGVSSYINRFHGFLGRRIVYGEFILEMQEA